MYACKQCGTGNPLDSSFCKKCGGALPESELAEAKLKLNEMLEEGNNLFTDGRTDEAMLIAETAVAANPSSHLAHSLKGLCHERQGEIAEALECYEVAVGLNPDSSLDKVKVAALRNRLAQRVSDTPEPNRRSAAVMAGASMVVVLVLGCMVAIGMNSRHEQPKLAANTPAETQQVVPGFTQTPPVTPAATTAVTPPATAVTPPMVIPGDPNTDRISGLQYGNPGTQLPDVSNPGPGSVITIPEGPIHPPAPEQPGPTKGNVPNKGIDPPPGNVPGPSVAAGDTPKEDPGYMRVDFSNLHSKPTLGGSSDINDGHAATTMLQAAQEQFLLRHFDQAASRYSKVAEMGSNSPHVQQRLGDCYRELGRTDQSRSAYNRAINMYQTQIKLGKDVAGNQRGLDTCESALKVLGG